MLTEVMLRVSDGESVITTQDSKPSPSRNGDRGGNSVGIATESILVPKDSGACRNDDCRMPLGSDIVYRYAPEGCCCS